jgi:hypothetical protein
MITTTFMGLGVGVAAGAAADGEEGDGLPEPQARWKSSPAEINETILVVWGNPVIREMNSSLEYRAKLGRPRSRGTIQKNGTRSIEVQ